MRERGTMRKWPALIYGFQQSCSVPAHLCCVSCVLIFCLLLLKAPRPHESDWAWNRIRVLMNTKWRVRFLSLGKLMRLDMLLPTITFTESGTAAAPLKNYPIRKCACYRCGWCRFLPFFSANRMPVMNALWSHGVGFFTWRWLSESVRLSYTTERKVAKGKSKRI